MNFFKKQPPSSTNSKHRHGSKRGNGSQLLQIVEDRQINMLPEEFPDGPYGAPVLNDPQPDKTRL